VHPYCCQSTINVYNCAADESGIVTCFYMSVFTAIVCCYLYASASFMAHNCQKDIKPGLVVYYKKFLGGFLLPFSTDKLIGWRTKIILPNDQQQTLPTFVPSQRYVPNTNSLNSQGHNYQLPKCNCICLRTVFLYARFRILSAVI